MSTANGAQQPSESFVLDSNSYQNRIKAELQRVLSNPLIPQEVKKSLLETSEVAKLLNANGGFNVNQ